MCKRLTRRQRFCNMAVTAVVSFKRDDRAGEVVESRTFEDFFQAEQARLFGALCLVTGNRKDAEDVGQEAFVRVWERWDRVGTMLDPRGYLYRVAMNECRSRWRRARLAPRWMASTHSERDELADVEDRDTVLQMLGRLIPQQRAAIVLTVMLGYTSEEAGKVLGMRGSTVRVLCTRARAALRTRDWEGS